LTTRPVLPAATSRVGLPREKGRDLQDVENLGGRLYLREVMDVGEDRQVELSLDPGQNA
jgi:hypothetical protein